MNIHENTTDLYISPSNFYGAGIKEGTIMEQCRNPLYSQPTGQAENYTGNYMPAEIVLTWNKYYE